jgi:opacity protein-like surface antigen
LVHRFLILALLLSAVTACKQAAQAHQPTRQEARIASQELIKQNLMSLGNAHFSSEGEMSIDELEPGRFRVRGFVDYQGQSGRAMRTNYTCVLRYGAKGKWDVEDLKWE